MEAHYVALILYASIYVVLVLGVSIYVYNARKNIYEKDKSRGNKDADGNKRPDNFLKQMLKAQEIYTACIVHIYDQATDIAVMVQWGQLLKTELDGENLPGVDMRTFFFPGLAFILLYRVISMFFAFYENTRYGRVRKKLNKIKEEQHHPDNWVEEEIKTKYEGLERQSFCTGVGDVILAAFDLYFVKVVYKEFQKGMYRPDQTHRSLQLCEALFERYLYFRFLYRCLCPIFVITRYIQYASGGITDSFFVEIHGIGGRY